jgi:hypothetical protein
LLVPRIQAHCCANARTCKQPRHGRALSRPSRSGGMGRVRTIEITGTHRFAAAR